MENEQNNVDQKKANQDMVHAEQPGSAYGHAGHAGGAVAKQDGIGAGNGNENGQIHGEDNKKKRPKYTQAQRTAIAKMADQGMGYRKIAQAAEMEKWGLNMHGVKDVCKRLKANGGDLEKLLRRKEGSGRPPKTATSANIEKVRAIIQDAPKSSLADIKQLTDIPRSSVQVILKTHLNKKPLTQVKGQRIAQRNVT